MTRSLVGLLLTLGLALTAAPAWADSEPYYVMASTVQASGAATVATHDLAQHPVRYFSLQVKGVGAAATAWDVRIEGSLDGTNFVPVVWHNAGDGDAAVKGSTATASGVIPYSYVRTRIVSATLGSATGITVKSLASQ